ncbi:hypothetical protein [Caballeronia zhejiangensis]|uniref:hypothetical protein n=1 Tax=Caballeronia zhejiangensis TaxID=871203 RepID=UPI0015889278|nr:hypothetical protein [Caballeronia zhejiangensis]MCG7403001.1 hypothetical protein [Caballeronia zhejiangensis]MCI1043826.1 hypothetical protein [Caballeronia zhejiangensis]
MSPHTKRMIRGLFEATAMLIVIGIGLYFIVTVLGGCTVVFVRSAGDVALEQVGGHNGWTVTPATHDTPSVRERLFGLPASDAHAHY